MNILLGDPATWDSGGPHVVTIGVFDGVHLGHQHVIGLVKDAAAAAGLRSGLITFDRHPLTVLAPQYAPPLLTSLDRRLELFEQAGLDTVGVLPFGDAVRTLSPEDFVMRAIVMGFCARRVVVGEDFRFGLDRAGNVEVLAMLGVEMGFDVDAVTLLSDQGPLSSSRIRSLVAEGDVVGASEALGRDFELRGLVMGERGRVGRTGVATSNLVIPEGLAAPRNGVYAVMVSYESHEEAPGVLYVGTRPTFGGTTSVMQFHLLDGATGSVLPSARIRFVSHIRDEQRFVDTATLAAAVAGDIEEARRVLDRQTP
ncbi:MAG: bifunctional riboflavin kinase/FMN adenylyltransferase [Acidimicrobiia bacterium]|nr:bifunctional riboflavin kinase/FMN adenylyltransferase [Acidimicrobiia bacterium]